MAYVNRWTYAQSSATSLDIITVHWSKSDDADPKVLARKGGSFSFSLTGDWTADKASIERKITADDGVEK